MLDLRRQRVSTREIARLLNRSQDAIQSQLRYVPAKPGQRCGKQRTERRAWAPKPSPSERLRVATLIAIVHFANDNGLDVDAAATRLLYARQG